MDDDDDDDDDGRYTAADAGNRGSEGAADIGDAYDCGQRWYTPLSDAVIFVRDVETLLITVAQCWIPYRAVRPWIRWCKRCTTRRAYWAYMLWVACVDARLGVRTIVGFYLSRSVNAGLKHACDQARPYNAYPITVTFFGKRKRSPSFPSQSVQTMWFMRCAMHRAVSGHMAPWLVWQGYFVFVVAILACTRLYRGLHYPHDMLGSLLLAHALGVLLL